jgi:hypothetical protein
MHKHEIDQESFCSPQAQPTIPRKKQNTNQTCPDRAAEDKKKANLSIRRSKNSNHINKSRRKGKKQAVNALQNV